MITENPVLFQQMDLDQLQDGVFHVWQPNVVDLLKSEDPAGDDWRIGGFASTEALDRQGESVLQKGLDFSEFIQHGYYNDNHQQHTAAAVGVPDEARYVPGKGWYTEGYLLKGVQRAVDIYNLAKALVGTPRKLGFSIEGKILERLGNKIVKALIRNVAITNSPVNTQCTWGILAKSWATDIEAKALSVGHARAAESGGRVLVPEDLEHDELTYIYKCPKCNKAFSSAQGLEAHMSKVHKTVSTKANTSENVVRRTAKSLNRIEAISYLGRLRPEYSENLRAKLVDYVLNAEII